MGQSIQCINDQWIVIVRELGKEVVPNSCAGPSGVEVGGISPPRLRKSGEIGLNFVTVDVKERSHERRAFRQPSQARDAGQTFGAGASKHSMENGFGLIVPRLTDRDETRLSLQRNLRQPGIARLAGVGFKMIWTLRNPTAEIARETEALGESRDEARIVTTGLTSGRVVEVRDEERETRLGSNRM